MAISSVSNQTDPAWINQSPPHQLGTGVFLIHVVDPNDPDAVWREDVPDLTYNQCRRRTDHPAVKAFKWVPHWVADYVAIISERCGGPCSHSTGCVEPGCICDLVKRRCVPHS